VGVTAEVVVAVEVVDPLEALVVVEVAVSDPDWTTAG
jgi:hypothetical protein